jgi:hypothetical protein
MTAAKLASPSIEDLVLRVDDVLAKGRRLTGQLLLLLIDIEDRRVEFEGAYPSMLELCIRRFGMSEGRACRHLAASRLLRECPKLLGYIESGDIHLSRVSQLRHVLKADNVDELVAATRGKSKYEVAELIRHGSPRPAVRGTMRKLPTFHTDAELAPADEPSSEPRPESRYRLQMTISRALRDRVERVLDLTTHSNPDRDLTVLFERAIDVLLDSAERDRRGEASVPDADASTRMPAIEPSDATQDEATTKTRRNAKRSRKSEPTNEARRRASARDGGPCTAKGKAGWGSASDGLDVDDALGRAEDDDEVRARGRTHEGGRSEVASRKKHASPAIRPRQRASNSGRQGRPPMQANVTSGRASSARAAGRASVSSSRGASSASAAS